MSNLAKLVPALFMFALTTAHSTPHDIFAPEGGNPQSPSAKGDCGPKLIYAEIDPTKSLELVKTNNPLENVAANTTVEIMKTKFQGMLGPDRDRKQEELARQGGELLFKEIMKIQGLDNEQATVEAVTTIAQLGHVRKDVLDGFGDIISQSVASLEEPKGEDFEFNRDTANALGEMTRVVSNYRKTSFDVNLAAKILFFLRLKKQSDYVRNNFTSVKKAAEQIDDTLETSIALMTKRHFQFLDGRVQLKALERYAQLSSMMGQEAQRLLEEYMAENNFNDLQKAAFTKNAISPLADRVIQLTKLRSVMSLSYAQFTLLMDGNLSLISMISNIRETAQLEITVFGAAKIALNEMQKLQNLGTGLEDAFDHMRNDTVEGLKKFGITQRKIPERKIKSIQDAVVQFGQLQNELQAGIEFRQNTIQKYHEAIAVLEPQLNQIQAQADAGFVNLESLTKKADKTLSENGVARKGTEFEKMPSLPPPLSGAAAN